MSGLRVKWQRIQRKKSMFEDEDSDSDIALFGKYYKCGKIGHKLVDCRVSNSDNTKGNGNTNQNGWKLVQKHRGKQNSNFKCNYCNKPGHHWVKCCNRLRDEANGTRVEQGNTRKDRCKGRGEISLMDHHKGNEAKKPKPVNFNDVLCNDDDDDDYETKMMKLGLRSMKLERKNQQIN
jgi:hypothetical protein